MSVFQTQVKLIPENEGDAGLSSNNKRTDKGETPEVDEAVEAVQEISDAAEGLETDVSTEAGEAATDAVEDAIEVAETAAEDAVETVETEIEDALVLEDAVSDEEISEIEDSVEAEAEAEAESGFEATDAVESDPEPALDSEPEPAPEPEPVIAPAPVAAPAQKSGGGFVPAVLGGLVAAGLGYGAAQFSGMSDPVDGPDPVETALAAQGERMSALEGQISELTAALAAASAPQENPLIGQLTELSGQLDTKIAGLGDVLGERLTGMETALGAVNERLTVVEKRPLVESSEAATAALGAYEREIEGLRQSLEAQQANNAEIAAELEEAVAAAQSEMAAVADRAGSLQEQADATAQAAAQREAMASLDASLARGTPYGAALAVLAGGAEVPAVLSDNAESGVASMAALRASYPGAARAALDASLKETVSDDPVGRITAFLRTQSGARSLAPKEGDDPDAVLSRAEAALSEGQLADVLTELTALPAAGQAVLSDWVAQAQTRLDVTSAASELAAATQSN